MRHVVTGMMVLALVVAALPALAHHDPNERLRGYEAGLVVGTDHPPTTTFALGPGGGPAKKGNYTASKEVPTPKQLELSGIRGASR